MGKQKLRGPKHKPDALGIRAIIQYLEEVYDKEKKLTYESPNERQLLDQWLHFQMSGQVPYGFSVLHPEKIPSAIDRYKNEIQRILGVLNTALEGKDCLVGDMCTFADLSVLPWNCRLDALLRTPPEVDPLEAFSNVQKGHQRMVSHDAWKRAMEIRDKLMDEQGLQSNGMPKGITNIKE
ncbi:hypothetical protein ZTR_09611 [Talaromyces verruculosus]|nr:hypothetical protein ZTR_09611 [Talaromyces verruculosus]